MNGTFEIKEAENVGLSNLLFFFPSSTCLANHLRKKMKQTPLNWSTTVEYVSVPNEQQHNYKEILFFHLCFCVCRYDAGCRTETYSFSSPFCFCSWFSSWLLRFLLSLVPVFTTFQIFFLVFFPDFSVYFTSGFKLLP